MKLIQPILLLLSLCFTLVGCAKRQTVSEEPPPPSTPPAHASEVQDLLKEADEAIAKAVTAGAEKSASAQLHDAKEYRSFCVTSTQTNDLASARFQCSRALALAREAQNKASQTKPEDQKKKSATPAKKPGPKKQ